jgi:hypothetical protein
VNGSIEQDFEHNTNLFLRVLIRALKMKHCWRAVSAIKSRHASNDG